MQYKINKPDRSVLEPCGLRQDVMLQGVVRMLNTKSKSIIFGITNIIPSLSFMVFLMWPLTVNALEIQLLPVVDISNETSRA